MKSNYNFFKKNIVIGIIVFINILFTFKYISRYSDYAVFVIIPLIILYYFLLNGKGLNFSNKLGFAIILCSSVLFISFSVILFNKIPAETLNVDRWSVITSFWDSLLDGNYPYFAKSEHTNPPGPMPMYFILAFPFYAINELGFLSIVGSILLLLLLFAIKTPINIITKISILIFCSVFYLWEIVSRSNILFNSVIILAVLVHFNSIEKNNWKLYLNAFLAGLVLSTRSILVIPFIVVIMSALIRKDIKFKSLINYSLISITTFSLTFLPFIIIFPKEFLMMNPFIVQSTFLLPPAFAISFVLIAILSAFLSKTINETYFYSGLTLFISILIYFLYYIDKSGFYQAYIQSEVDISYFIFCVPFLLLYFIKTHPIIDK